MHLMGLIIGGYRYIFILFDTVPFYLKYKILITHNKLPRSQKKKKIDT